MYGTDLTLYEEDERRFAAVLQRLCTDAKSRAVFLIDKSGQLIASAGETASVDTTSLASLTAGNIAATGGLAQLLGEKEFSVLFHEGEKEHLPPLSQKKPGLVIQTAREITSLPIDVLKAEFPADLSETKDEAALLDLCYKLNEASQTPWVILSAGVDFDTYCQEVRLACRAGASGLLAGRAIWQEAAHMADKRERGKFLSTVAVDRMKRLLEIAMEYAVPWHKKLGLPRHELAQISESWFRDY